MSFNNNLAVEEVKITGTGVFASMTDLPLVLPLVLVLGLGLQQKLQKGLNLLC